MSGLVQGSVPWIVASENCAALGERLAQKQGGAQEAWVAHEDEVARLRGDVVDGAGDRVAARDLDVRRHLVIRFMAAWDQALRIHIPILEAASAIKSRECRRLTKPPSPSLIVRSWKAATIMPLRMVPLAYV